jgi:hypothetical protein
MIDHLRAGDASLRPWLSPFFCFLLRENNSSFKPINMDMAVPHTEFFYMQRLFEHVRCSQE